MLSIEYVDPSAIKLYAKNTRTHSPEQIAQIAVSISTFGFTNPVLTDEKLVLIAGHGRTLAALQLKEKKIPVIRLKGLTVAQKTALRIADNKIALNARWDEEILIAELMALDGGGFDMLLTGFTGDEIARLLDQPDAPPPDPDQDNYVEQYAVIVVCKDAGHQEKVFNELQAKGFEVKVVNT